MQHLYEALTQAHPGFDVVDVKFLTNPSEADDQKAVDLDPKFAAAIETAVEVEPSSFE